MAFEPTGGGKLCRLAGALAAFSKEATADGRVVLSAVTVHPDRHRKSSLPVPYLFAEFLGAERHEATRVKVHTELHNRAPKLSNENSKTMAARLKIFS